MQKRVAQLIALLYILGLYLLLPVLPLMASLVFMRKKYTLEYGATVQKIVVHIQALREGPVLHFFSDVLGRKNQVPANIQGYCNQCGNCCMNHRCMFLEKVNDKKYQCSIYHSPFRKFSNCGSFPLNGNDIARYTCPTYFTIKTIPALAQPLL